MKKIIVLVPTDTLAGAELTLKRIASYLSLQGNHVLVIFMSKGDNHTWCDVPAQKIYLKAETELKSLILLLKEIFKLRISGEVFDYSFTSHVHCNALISIMRLFKMVRIKNQIIRESTNIFSWFTGRKLALFKFLYGCYAKDAVIICQTPRMKSELLVNVPRLKDNNVFVLNNSIDFHSVRKKSHLPIVDQQKHKEIVVVGRLVREKGCGVLLNAFSKLQDKSYFLRFVGSGPLLDELRILANTLGIHDRVIFSGFSNNPIPYMRAAELCVVSSINEGFPNTLLEIMCVARRVVSTECTDGIKGMPGIITCAPASDEALALAIQQSLTLDKPSTNENIKKMRRHIAQLTVPRYVDSIFKKVHSS